MMLVDAGELALDDPVSKFVRELGGAPVGAATVRHALSHTSGLPFASGAELGDAARFDGSAFKRYRDTGDDAVYDAVGLRDAAASYTMPLRSEPGASFLYSNAGINLVGRIIEVVSGEEYADFVDRRLLEPLGMRDTTLWPSDAQLERLAAGHSGDGSLRRVPSRSSRDRTATAAARRRRRAATFPRRPTARALAGWCSAAASSTAGATCRRARWRR